MCFLFVPKTLAFSVTLSGLTIGENATQLQNLLVWRGGKMREAHTEIETFSAWIFKIEIFSGWIFNLPCQHFQSLSLSIWHHLCITVITWDITGLY